MNRQTASARESSGGLRSRLPRVIAAITVGSTLVFALTAPGFADRGEGGAENKGRGRPPMSLKISVTGTATASAFEDGYTETPENHGWYVSRVARTVTPGPDHGKIVSAVARGELDPEIVLGTATRTPTGTPVSEESQTPTPTSTPDTTGTPTATSTPELNHGQIVSEVARDVPPGPEHGNIVSGVARGDISPADLTGTPTATPTVTNTSTPTVTPTPSAEVTDASTEQQTESIGSAVIKFLSDLVASLI